jgi:hypothetical protein
MKVEPDRFAAYARRADTHVREGRAASAPDIQVSIEYLDDPPTAVRRSAVLPIARSLEGATLGGASLDVVPVIAVAKHDLAWFELEAEANAILAMIDGHTTVAEILASIAVAPERALELMRELEVQRVIALG